MLYILDAWHELHREYLLNSDLSVTIGLLNRSEHNISIHLFNLLVWPQKIVFYLFQGILAVARIKSWYLECPV